MMRQKYESAPQNSYRRDENIKFWTQEVSKYSKQVVQYSADLEKYEGQASQEVEDAKKTVLEVLTSTPKTDEVITQFNDLLDNIIDYTQEIERAVTACDVVIECIQNQTWDLNESNRGHPFTPEPPRRSRKS